MSKNGTLPGLKTGVTDLRKIDDPSETCESVLESITCPICEAKITLETNTDETKDN